MIQDRSSARITVIEKAGPAVDLRTGFFAPAGIQTESVFNSENVDNNYEETGKKIYCQITINKEKRKSLEPFILAIFPGRSDWT
ncbi:MAG TPA: hypothetical protein PLI23_00520 [Thermoclostridium caenicola]|uniref:hypothetical protein n=1 Tax=Thermoclostridium caenicola TaxID=659425 RepID=UPI002CAF36BD|nr:hypothetical protein [Thermoclostridium caenicola]HPO75642.1 hypothetical protein [Thermoclostridium caenicola]